MKKKFVVAYISHYDNVLEQHIVAADDWRSALEAAKPGYLEYVKDCKTLEEAAEEAFNQDWGFHVVEVT